MHVSFSGKEFIAFSKRSIIQTSLRIITVEENSSTVAHVLPKYLGFAEYNPIFEEGKDYYCF